MVRLARIAHWRRSGHLWPVSILLALTLWMVRPLFFGTPLSHDHPTHLFRAWHFWEEGLCRFRLGGFSHIWGFGFPAGEFVGPGSEIWMALVRALSLGQLPWLRTYSLGMVAMVALLVLSSYWFTARYFGRTAGFVTGILVLFDPGGWAQGGWDWYMTLGVWPVSLATSFVLLGLVAHQDVLEHGRGRDVVRCALWFGAALLTHQLPLLILPIVIPLQLIDHWIRSRGVHAHYSKALLVVALGAAWPSFFLIPMLARSAQTLDLGVRGIPLSELARRLVSLSTFDQLWPGFVVLGLVGAWTALRRSTKGGFLMVAATGISVILSSDILNSWFHLERLSASFTKIEAQRMLLVAKLFFFPLVGLVLSEPLRALACAADRWRIAPSYAGRRWLWLLAALPLVPVLASGLEHFKTAHLRTRVITEAELPHWKDYQQFLIWSKDLRAKSREHYRIAYEFHKDDHLSTLTPVFNGTLMHKIGYTPAQNFARLPSTSEPWLLQALSVKYVVSDKQLPRDLFEFERSFGALKVHRFKSYQPHPFTVLGAGRAEMLEFSPERLRLRLSQTASDSRIKLHVAHTDRWEATLHGQVQPITSVAVQGAADPFLMEIPVKDGELEVRYVRRLVDWVGLMVSALSWPTFFGVCWLVGEQQRRARLAHVLARAKWWLGSLAVAGLLVLITVLIQRHRQHEGLLPPESLFRHLEPHQLQLAGLPCTPAGIMTYQCGAAKVQAGMVGGMFGSHNCMNAPPIGTLTLRLDQVQASFLTGRYDPSTARGQIRVRVGTSEVANVPARLPTAGLQFIKFDLRPYREPGGGSLEIEMSGSVLTCFDWVLESE